jgi:hypothetical protein
MKPRRAKGKIAFHSLRKSVIQRLQKNLPGERRKALVGHEAGDGVHEAFYMRPWTADELATFFPELAWPFIDKSALKAVLLLAETVREPRQKETDRSTLITGKHDDAQASK